MGMMLSYTYYGGFSQNMGNFYNIPQKLQPPKIFECIETQEEGLSLSLIWPSLMNLLLLQARMMRPKQSGGHCQTCQSWPLTMMRLYQMLSRFLIDIKNKTN